MQSAEWLTGVFTRVSLEPGSRGAIHDRPHARERNELFDAFLNVCEWTRIYYTWRPNVRDESDNHIVELAVAGGAQAIVTKNVRDFTRMELRFPGIRVMTPAALLWE